MSDQPATPATTPEPPYYAVIFTTLQPEMDDAEAAAYAETAARMEDLARAEPGYLGMESARSGLGITVSYWSDTDSIQRWRANTDHTLARDSGRERWYESYELRVARVERAYGWQRGR